MQPFPASWSALVTRSCLALIALSLVDISASTAVSQDGSTDRDRVASAMKSAAKYYHDKVAVHGGYVYFYSADLQRRLGEGAASPTQIWVQPPGTPTVGISFLNAYEATGDQFYLDAATQAAEAIAYGQLQSGGWTNSIDFDPRGRVAQYRNGKGGGKNNSSLDDGQTQSALQLLILVDGALQFKNKTIHQAAETGLTALLQAQFDNGGFPQIWTGPVDHQPIVKASYPDYDWRTEGRIKNYWDMYTVNDNIPGYLFETLAAAHKVYQDDKYEKAIRRLGDFLVLAQLPDPQPGWAQQYNYTMNPIWARRFEPPGVSGDETQEVLQTLMSIFEMTNDRKYLQPIPRGIAWLNRSLLEEGKFARYYELETNKPLYMERRGDTYSLTYDDSNLPSHYGWKTESYLEEIEKRFARLKDNNPDLKTNTSLQELKSRAGEIVASLDERGRWLDRYDGERLVGQAKFQVGESYLSSERFSGNVTVLSNYLKTTAEK